MIFEPINYVFRATHTSRDLTAVGDHFTIALSEVHWREALVPSNASGNAPGLENLTAYRSLAIGKIGFLEQPNSLFHSFV